MTIIITKGRFEGVPQHYTALADVADLAQFSGKLDVPSDTDPASLVPHLGNFTAIRIGFPTSADGRGNSIAKALRQAGYKGSIRAFGHVLADQYPLALRSGFDDVEIENALAERQPESQWADAFTRIQHNYLSRVKTAGRTAKAAA